MFTGIVEATGTVKNITRKGEDARLEVDTSMDLGDVMIGDSIAVSGACLTVTELRRSGFIADVSAETLDKTILKAMKQGNTVNLEKALKLNSFLGGHLVLGHVDGIGTICDRFDKSTSIILGIEIDTNLSKYVVEKGSIAIDGVSLTVNRCERNRLYVNIIPHTARATTLESKKVRDRVNIETDILGKYIDKLLHPDKESAITMDFLSEHGFVK
ncbi:MAG TPA: riboflavin synthase [Deltaproteobacteria bacterium]|nr:riboflavin synthase [Deltaproteobacteria bacterium]